mgnify:FL=1
MMKNLTPTELSRLAEERLIDAKTLFEAERYDGAFYICGYALEMALKSRVCHSLNWDEYPGNGKDGYKSFRTHKFDDLLHLSGVEKEIRAKLMSEWSIVMKWDPEIRYSSEKQKKEALTWSTEL